MINSEGIGGNKFSRNMAAKMAPYPNHWFASTACPINSGSWVISSDRPINNDDKVMPLFHTFLPNGILRNDVIHTTESDLEKGEISLPSVQQGIIWYVGVWAISQTQEQSHSSKQNGSFTAFSADKTKTSQHLRKYLLTRKAKGHQGATKHCRPL